MVSIYLSNAYNYLSWKKMERAYHNRISRIPFEALIAPSRNLLQSQAFHERRNIRPFLNTQKIEEVGLKVPTHYASASLSDHCVSMSLHFLQRYRDNHRDITIAADKMALGADVDCARGTVLHQAVLNAHLNLSVKSEEEEFLSKLRHVVADSLGLSIKGEITLKMPLEEMFDYLNQQLQSGEYVIRFPGHLVSLVKNEQGVYIFDCSQGTVKLIEQSKPWFINLLSKHKINRTETLSLLPVYRQGDLDTSNGISKEVVSTRDKPSTLSFKKLEGRWEGAELQFRGKTYTFIKDKETNLIYNDNSKNFIRFKLFLLTGRTLIDTSIRTIYHIAMTALHLIALPACTWQGKEKALECLGKIIRSSFDIFRAPLYGLLGSGAAFYGMFKPYEGRRLYADFERSLNRQNREVSFKRKYYIAPCFSPLNFNVTDKKEDKQNIEALKKYAIRSEELNKKRFFDLFCGWTRQISRSN